MKELVLNTDSMVVLLVTVLLAFGGIILRIHGEISELRHSHRESLKEAKGEAGSQFAALETRLRTAEAEIVALRTLYTQTDAGRITEFARNFQGKPHAGDPVINHSDAAAEERPNIGGQEKF